VAIISALRDEPAALEWRWKLALCGADLMLRAFGMDATAVSWARERRNSYAREFASSTLPRQLGMRFREQRKSLSDLMRLASSAEATEYPALAALMRRNERLAAVGAALNRLELAGRLTVPFEDLVASLAHMWVNRLLRSQQRMQEYIIFEFLYRLRYAEGVRELSLTPKAPVLA
jgi:thiopeptide-type bacteriocin biosynthesis protein